MAASGGVTSSVPRVLTLWCPEWPVRAVAPIDGPLIVFDQHRVSPPAPSHVKPEFVQVIANEWRCERAQMQRWFHVIMWLKCSRLNGWYQR